MYMSVYEKGSARRLRKHTDTSARAFLILTAVWILTVFLGIVICSMFLHLLQCRVVASGFQVAVMLRESRGGMRPRFAVFQVSLRTSTQLRFSYLSILQPVGTRALRVVWGVPEVLP